MDSDNIETIERHLRRATRTAWWVGAALGLVFGKAAGIAIGYNRGSDQVIVIPLDRGIET